MTPSYSAAQEKARTPAPARWNTKHQNHGPAPDPGRDSAPQSGMMKMSM
jgi:hypothetical protein